MRSLKRIVLLLVTILALTGCGTVTVLLAPATQTPIPLPTPTIETTSVIENDGVVLTWERRGGLAGFCDEVVVYADGKIMSSSCRPQATQRTHLSVVQLAQLTTWIEAFKPFEYVQSDDAVADSMTVQLTFSGQGTQAASEAEIEHVLDFARLLLPLVPPENIHVLQTGVRYVLATRDIAIHAGPGQDYPQIGQVFDGQVAWVTGTSIDEAWWRVICPDGTVGSCWLTAEPELTQPTTPPGSWPVFMFPEGMSVDYPAGWLLEPSTYDETQHSVWFVAPETAGPSVSFEMYHRPLQEMDIADPFTWQPNEGGYQVYWSGPITTVQGLVGIEFVWGAYSEGEGTWDAPPQLMVIYYSSEYEMDVRLITQLAPTLDLAETTSLTETVAAQFGSFHRMAERAPVPHHGVADLSRQPGRRHI